ncbi:RNA-binding protein hfq [Pannus brasiliensis CCIBt3594]|uniref:RNA-binding protein hfq n=1 Tax=Pannus brasiliensis CCIBt3594 TaxID=1427578 RepID=A0AAW9QVX8_9CHRO
MSQFNTGLPSVRLLQGYVKDKQEVEVKLSTDEILVGRLLWQDVECLCLVDQDDRPTLVWRQSLVSLKPKA